MPYVNIQITKGRNEITEGSTHERGDGFACLHTQKEAGAHSIVIQEIVDEDWGFSGLLTDDWKKKQAR